MDKKELGIRKAQLFTNSVEMSAFSISHIVRIYGEENIDNPPDINTLCDEIKNNLNNTAEGQLSNSEITLTAQAKTLDTLFNTMISRALKLDRDFARVCLDVALRAQNQCRKTLLALDAIKNPKQIVSQQNIALNQQINNSGVCNVPSNPSSKIKLENELLETNHEQRLDKGTSRTPSKIDPSMEALEVNRRQDSRRQSNQ